MRITRRKRTVDPTEVRLSEHFLLSDFMGCSSVYARGYQNVFTDPTGALLEEGKYLCDTLLEPILADFGPLSVGYGYISPSLSRLIVKYQDPDKPSYHRWDKGAAADICVHSWVKKHAPVYLAFEIDEKYPYSRMITYSESPYICVATQISEGDKPRKAFYENQYEGREGRQPKHVKYSASPVIRGKQKREHELPCDWRGAGYPTYHGGGAMQWHHRRASRYTMVTDFLYSSHAVSTGVPNIPTKRTSVEIFAQAGEFYDSILKSISIPRISIVRAYESPRFSTDERHLWERNFCLELIPPEYIDASEIAEAAWDSGMVKAISVCNATRRVRVESK